MRHYPLPSYLGALAALTLALVAGNAAHANAERLHLALVKSEPAKGDTVRTPPRAVRLWFSLAPQLGLSNVKVSNQRGVAVALLPPQIGADDPKRLDVPVKDSLADGTYLVAWRTASKDGHPQRGTFTFTVRRTAAR